MPRLAVQAAFPDAAAISAPPPSSLQALALAPGARISGRAGEALDSFNAAGAVLLGRRSPLVEAAVARAGARDLPRLHAAALDILCEHHPRAEAAAVCGGGAFALHAALAGARALTGRPDVIDLSRCGLAELARSLDGGRVAAVVAAPLALEGEDAPARLHAARRLCDRHGAALLLDERMSAPRCGLGGAQALWRVEADLAVYGPALANGRPLGALTGRADLLAAARAAAPDAFHPAAPALAAMGAVALVLRHAPVHAVLHVRGSELQAELEAALAATGADRFARVAGDPTAVRLAFDHPALSSTALRRFVQRELWSGGVLMRGHVHVTFAWADAEVSRMVDACRTAFAAVARSVSVWERCRTAA